MKNVNLKHRCIQSFSKSLVEFLLNFFNQNSRKMLDKERLDNCPVKSKKHLQKVLDLQFSVRGNRLIDLNVNKADSAVKHTA